MKESNLQKIMLAAPNDAWFDNRHWHNFPYTFGVLNSVLKDKYEVKILDAGFENLNFEQVKQRINDYNPDVFGLTCMSMEYARQFQKMTALVKEVYPKTPVIVGGIYPTLLPEVIMHDKNIDYAVLGEGEYRFPKLLEKLEKNEDVNDMEGIALRLGEDIKINKVESYIQDLDALPLPNYDNLDFNNYANTTNKYSYFVYPRRLPYANTITSRGCPFNCIFCSSKVINGPKIRYRSPESVLKEIDWLVDEKGVKEIIFMDDNFFLDHKRVKIIMNGLIERKHDLEWKNPSVAVYALNDEILELTRASGGYQLILAIESGNLEGLKRLNKPTSILKKIKPIVKKARSLDFQLSGLFVIGTPGETWEEIRNSFKLADELDLDCYSFNIATPLPKTKLYQIAKEGNFLSENFSFDNVDTRGFGRATITTPEFTPQELQIVRAYEWDRICFSRPEKIKKIAEMNGITLDEVDKWRKSTRRTAGTKVDYD
ncbi:MAG: radical SAM protein [Nanoarchaeota archaeon]